MLSLRKATFKSAPALLVGALLCFMFDLTGPSKLLGTLATVSLAIGLGAFPNTRGYQYTVWIVVSFLTGMLYPQHFQQFNDHKWFGLLLVQAVMFGMGTQMKLKDFAGVFTMPWSVFVGLLCQFTIMPLIGFTLAKLIGFPPEIAAGIILIGSCSSGLASNVMAFLAKANLALSITLTSMATLLAPVMTPLWMKLLAGEMIEVSFVAMMATVVKIVVVPIGAALIHDLLREGNPTQRKLVFALTTLAAAWLAILVLGGWGWITNRLEGNALLLGVVLPGYLLSTFLVATLYHTLTKKLPKLEASMPMVSMFGICYFTLVATAAGQASLRQVGFLLLVAAIIHNIAGYLLGYGLSRLFRLTEEDARTVALEVGLQNGGMASGIALSIGKLGTVGLASAIFSPWMNVSGSVLANYWRRVRPLKFGDDSPPESRE